MPQLSPVILDQTRNCLEGLFQYSTSYLDCWVYDIDYEDIAGTLCYACARSVHHCVANIMPVFPDEGMFVLSSKRRSW